MSKFGLILILLCTLGSNAHAVTQLGFGPYMESNCYSEVWEAPTVKHGNCVQNPTTSGYPRWTVSGTHESAGFTGGSQTNIRLGDPVMGLDFYSVPATNRYGVSMALDKINYPNYVDHSGPPGRDIRPGHTSIFFNETAGARANGAAPVFNLSEDVYVQFNAELVQLEQSVYPPVGNAEVRIIFGTMAVWDSKAHFLEVNLMKTPGYDRCKNVNISLPGNEFAYDAWDPLLVGVGSDAIVSPYPAGLGLGPVCDSTNTYDHRFAVLNGGINRDFVTTELVYYNVANLPFNPAPVLSAGGGFKSYLIPVSKIFRQYNWLRKPLNGSQVVDWSTVMSHGGGHEISFYIGMEILGTGRAWIRVKDVLIWRPLS